MALRRTAPGAPATSSPHGAAQPLRGELEALLGADRVLGRASDIVRYASDASPYRLFPQAVVMARDAADVAKVLAYGRAQRRPGHLPRRRHQPQRAGAERRHPGRRAPPLRRRRGRGGRRAGPGQARHRARPRQPRPRPARPQARPRPGQHRHRHGRRGDRQQLGRDALRRHQGLLLDRALDDLRPALGDDDRHRRPRRRRALRRRGARAGRGPRGDPRRDPRRRRAERAHPPQVRDQEHDRLPALRLPRRRGAAGDLPPPHRRLRGDARLRRRGGLRDRAAAGPHRPPPGSTSPASTRRSPRSATSSTPAPPRSS